MNLGRVSICVCAGVSERERQGWAWPSVKVKRCSVCVRRDAVCRVCGLCLDIAGLLD